MVWLRRERERERGGGESDEYALLYVVIAESLPSWCFYSLFEALS